MDGPDTGLVRWSPNATVDSFLHINLQHRIVQLYEPTGYAKTGRFEYRNVSKHEDFPTLTTFDWSPSITGLVAVGTPTGVVNLLKIDDNSNAYLELSLKMSRTCQAVSFSTSNLLAVGLDRVRSDRCLYIWDVNRLSTTATGAVGFPRDMEPFGEPVDVREPSVSVSSVRFFEDNPNTLVIGIKGQGLRIHDLRDPGNQMPSFPTRCNNNLAVDYADPNYFASSALDHPGLMIWDRRAGSRSMASPQYLDAVDIDGLPWGGALRLARAVASEPEQPPTVVQQQQQQQTNQHHRPQHHPAAAVSDGNKGSSAVIRSLRYCRDHRGMLGVLSGAGQLKVYETTYEYCPAELAAERSPELLEVRRSNEMDNQYSDPRHRSERIVSFDWVTIGTPALRPRVLALRASGAFAILEKPSFTTTYPFKLIPWTAPYRGLEGGTAYHGMMQLEMAQAAEILGPVALEEALADIPIFATDADEIQAATAQAQKARAALLDGDGNNKKAKLPAEYFAATTVAQKLRILRTYAKKNLRAKAAATDLADSTASLASQSGRPLSSQELHESLLASTLSRQGFPSEAQAVLDHVMLLRAKERYLFDCARNRQIVADDPWLRDMWGWVGDAEAAAANRGMTAHCLDLSFMGVASIWLEELGAQPGARILHAEALPATFPDATNWQRTISAICRERRVPRYDGPVETRKPHHRQLCLEICGWGRPEDVDVDDIGEGEGPEEGAAPASTTFTMAAAQALFRGDTRQAVQILKRASAAHPELLFVSLALQLGDRGMDRGMDKSGDEQRPALDFDATVASRTDPYLRAISSLIATGDWTAIANQTSLPLRERVFVAVRTFDDERLTQFLRRARAAAVAAGDVEGLVLAGLGTEAAVDLWARYLAKFPQDVQTAVLALSLAAPRYVDDHRITAWRSAYRAYLQRHRAFFQRAKFEVESTQRSKGLVDGRPRVTLPPRQIALRCVYCDAQTRLGAASTVTASATPAATASATTATTATTATAPAATTTTTYTSASLPAQLALAGISCPNCKRHLPRCVVCLEIVGMPRSDAAGAASTDADSRYAGRFPAFCLRCDHVLHLDHARQWFARHVECPVPGCRCRCNFRANPELNYS